MDDNIKTIHTQNVYFNQQGPIQLHEVVVAMVQQSNSSYYQFKHLIIVIATKHNITAIYHQLSYFP